MFKYLVLFTCIVLFLLHVINAQECEKNEENKPITEEERLRQDLLCNYNKHLVPLKNRSEEMFMAMSMNIVEYDIYDMGPQQLHLESEITLSWNDTYLVWDPTDYNSITEIIMSTDEIWIPEVMPEEMEFFSKKSSILASSECKLTNLGKVTCLVMSSHSGFCQSDDSRWPYNEYICEVEYMWIMQNNEIFSLDFPNVSNGTFTIQEKENSEWKIIERSSAYSGSGRLQRGLDIQEVFLEFMLVRNKIEGKMSFMLLSIFVLTSLSLMSFWANFETSDRVILCLINIVSHMWEIQNLEFQFSRLGHTVPYILCFYRDSLILALVILVETMVFKKIWMSDKPTPNWLAMVGRNLGKDVVRKILFIEAVFEPKEDQTSFEDELKFIKESNQMAKKRIIQIVDRLVFVIFLVAYFIMGTIILTY